MGKLLFGGGTLLVVVVLTIFLTLLGLHVYGICIAFSASIILGFICFFTPPSGLVVALIWLAFGYNIPQHLVNYFANN